MIEPSQDSTLALLFAYDKRKERPVGGNCYSVCREYSQPSCCCFLCCSSTTIYIPIGYLVILTRLANSLKLHIDKWKDPPSVLTDPHVTQVMIQGARRTADTWKLLVSSCNYVCTCVCAHAHACICACSSLFTFSQDCIDNNDNHGNAMAFAARPQ